MNYKIFYRVSDKNGILEDIETNVMNVQIQTGNKALKLGMTH